MIFVKTVGNLKGQVSINFGQKFIPSGGSESTKFSPFIPFFVVVVLSDRRLGFEPRTQDSRSPELDLNGS